MCAIQIVNLSLVIVVCEIDALHRVASYRIASILGTGNLSEATHYCTWLSIAVNSNDENYFIRKSTAVKYYRVPTVLITLVESSSDLCFFFATKFLQTYVNGHLS